MWWLMWVMCCKKTQVFTIWNKYQNKVKFYLLYALQISKNGNSIKNAFDKACKYIWFNAKYYNIG